MEGLISNSLIMSNYFYDPNQAWNPTYWNYTEPIQPNPRSTQPLYPSATTTSSEDSLLPQQLPYTPQYNYNAVQYAPQPGTVFQPPRWDPASWAHSGQAQLPQGQQGPLYNNYTGPAYPTHRPSITSSIPSYLSPSLPSQSETSRHNSAASTAASTIDRTTSEVSRSVSPNPSAIADYGYKNPDNSWSCAWPGCTSRSASLARAIYANTTNDTRRRCSVDMTVVRRLPRAASRVRRTVRGMKQSTTRRSRANGTAAAGCSAESTTW